LRNRPASYSTSAHQAEDFRIALSWRPASGTARAIFDFGIAALRKRTPGATFAPTAVKKRPKTWEFEGAVFMVRGLLKIGFEAVLKSVKLWM
jgi:hypothetical protein